MLAVVFVVVTFLNSSIAVTAYWSARLELSSLHRLMHNTEIIEKAIYVSGASVIDILLQRGIEFWWKTSVGRFRHHESPRTRQEGECVCSCYEHFMTATRRDTSLADSYVIARERVITPHRSIHRASNT